LRFVFIIRLSDKAAHTIVVRKAEGKRPLSDLSVEGKDLNAVGRVDASGSGQGPVVGP
jgi:hypothetical protein